MQQYTPLQSTSPARHRGVPGTLLAFIVVSALCHGLTLLFMTDPAAQIPQQHVGENILSAVLLSPTKMPAAASANQRAQSQSAQPHQRQPSTNKARKPITKKARHKMPPLNTAETATTFTASMDDLTTLEAAASIPATALKEISPSPDAVANAATLAETSSREAQSLASRREQQRNYLLGELQNRLHRYLTYPSRARRKGWQGEVTIAFLISAGGQLHNVRLSKSSGYSLLDRSALLAITKLKQITLPDTLGHLQAMELLLPVQYKLQEG